MLMQNFKSAVDLGIADLELSGLILVLGMLEREEFKYAQHLAEDKFGFNMANHFARQPDCGTVGCIAGWAEHLKGLPKGQLLDKAQGNLIALFAGGNSPHTITVDQAATALRSYLTTGDARWDLAVA